MSTTNSEETGNAAPLAHKGLAACPFTSTDCVMRHTCEASESWWVFLPGVLNNGSLPELSLRCVSTDSDRLELGFPDIKEPPLNEEVFARSVQAGMASVQKDLSKLFQKAERLRINKFSDTGKRATHFVDDAAIEQDDFLAREMRLAAVDFAEKRLQEAVARLRRMIDNSDLQTSSRLVHYHALGIALMESGNLAEAKRELLRVLASVRCAPPQPLSSDILDDLGMVYLYQGKFDASIRAHRRALLRNLFLQDQRRLARSCEHLGLSIWKRNKVTAATAIGWLLVSLSLRCALGFSADLADSMDSLGRVWSSVKSYSIALQLHRFALRHRSAVGDDHATAKTLTNLGALFRRLKNLSLALECHQRAMNIRKKAQDAVGMANSYNNLGLVLMNMGRIKSARKHVRKAYRLRHGMRDSLNMSRNLTNLRHIDLALSTKARFSRTSQ